MPIKTRTQQIQESMDIKKRQRRSRNSCPTPPRSTMVREKIRPRHESRVSRIARSKRNLSRQRHFYNKGQLPPLNRIIEGSNELSDGVAAQQTLASTIQSI